uniref:Uncharacterized protein n=1 Tax=Ascaris lumbricoides TaxID=6252 RepID=A0A0M3HIB6_ASCLU
MKWTYILNRCFVDRFDIFPLHSMLFLVLFFVAFRCLFSDHLKKIKKSLRIWETICFLSIIQQKKLFKFSKKKLAYIQGSMN